MKVHQKLSFDQAPESGYMLAYFRKKVVFEMYEGISKEELDQKIADKEEKYGDLLEMHLFDDKKEFRAVKTRKSDFNVEENEYITAQIQDEMNGKDYQKAGDYMDEEMFLEEKYKRIGEKLVVRNYLDYQENGMVTVCAYRLVGVVGKGEHPNG